MARIGRALSAPGLSATAESRRKTPGLGGFRELRFRDSVVHQPGPQQGANALSRLVLAKTIDFARRKGGHWKRLEKTARNTWQLDMLE